MSKAKLQAQVDEDLKERVEEAVEESITFSSQAHLVKVAVAYYLDNVLPDDE